MINNYKIITEDSALEEFAVGGMSDIAVPFEIRQDENGFYTITVYSALTKLAREYMDRYPESPLEDEAIRWLADKILPMLHDWGYTPDFKVSCKICCYSADNMLPDNGICTLKIDSTDEFEKYLNLTDRDIELEGSDETDVCFAVVKDGEILSYASVNDLCEEEGVLEINVGTAEGHRKKGYAAACVNSLSGYLTASGYRVLYKCNADNIASCNTALSAGLKPCGFIRSLVCFRD